MGEKAFPLALHDTSSISLAGLQNESQILHQESLFSTA